MIEAAVRDLKSIIAEHDGENVADRRFARRVDDLISVFYDDIGEITTVSSQTLFDLFVIKVLYVERSSTDASIVDYLGSLLDRYLLTRELFSINRQGRLSLLYLSDLLQEMAQLKHFQNLFEAYRKYGDNSLFITGVFPQAFRSWKRRWGRTVAFVDRSYFVSTGKRFYRMASEHELAEDTAQRPTLSKLSTYFEVYLGALNEMAERYIMGFDMNLIADKMLDSINAYRDSGENYHLQNARRYAAILQVNPDALSQAAKRRPALIDPSGAA